MKTKNKSIVVILVVLILIVLLTIAWAGLTRAGYIPNFLNVEFFCSERDGSHDPGSSQVEGCDPNSEFYDFCVQNQSFDCTVLGNCVDKPVIYLYPQRIQDIKVELDYQGKLIADYPEYDYLIKGWNVIASPDGTIKKDNQEYSYLFWEGIPKNKISWDLSNGFIIKGEDTREFLQETLSTIGLTPKEYNEFIVYWYPKMKDNNYNLIHFAEEQYTQTAPLIITPTPDSMLRVFMVYKPLEEEINIESQTLNKFERNGFTVVEWGGTKAE